MEFKDLIIFQMVADKGTITAAAKELNYVQSNITSRIRKLETELNTQLFHRHRRGMSLTPEGKKLLEYSEKILSLKTEMKAIVQTNQEPSGKLEIGTVETVIHLPKILSNYLKKYQHVDLSVFTSVSSELITDVLNYKLDGAFITKTTIDSELEFHEVFEEELVLVANHQFTSLDDLKKEPILCFSHGCGYRARLMDWYHDQNIVPKKIMEFGTLEIILRSAMMGLGIAFVPKSEIIKFQQEGLLTSHKLPEKYSKIKTVFIRRHDTH